MAFRYLEPSFLIIILKVLFLEVPFVCCSILFVN